MISGIKYGIVGVDSELGKALSWYFSQFKDIVGEIETADWSDLESIKKMVDGCLILFFVHTSAEAFRNLVEEDLYHDHPVTVGVWVNFAPATIEAVSNLALICDQISVRFDPSKGDNPFRGTVVRLSMNPQIANDIFIGRFSSFMAAAVGEGGRLDIR